MVALHDVSLDEHLDGADDEEIVAPESREHVDRLLGRLARIEAARAADSEIASARIEQVQDWLTARCEVHDNAAGHIRSLLHGWHEWLLQIDPKAKSVSLPNGVLKSRSHGEQIKVTDDQQFVEWAQKNRPDLVREVVRHVPDKTAAKTALRAADVYMKGLVAVDPSTGEEVPGVEVTPAGRTFSVETTVPEEVSA